MPKAEVLLPGTILTDNTFSMKELAFIQIYLTNGFNGTDAVQRAGYNSKDPGTYSGALLSREKIRKEIQARLAAREDARIAKASEILQFYTSVMRGEILDQFGIEASLDTRIKAANELARHQIELPMKLEQKNTANIGSITLNFIPRQNVPSICTNEETPSE